MMKHQEQEKKPNILFRLLALILTAALLLWQDKNAPRYIHIYDNEE